MQHGDDPVPLDYRDLVTRFHSLDQIDDAIAEFAPRVTEAWQTGRELPTGSPGTFLETLNLGASSAENELRDLSYYFLRTDTYQRAQRGDVRLVVGRKGSGKTAVFAQTRDNLRRNKQNIILDLRPEGYKLLKFKEDVLRLLEQGTFYHTITAFWEYVLLLEVCHKLLEKDRERHKRDSTLFEPYRVIADLYEGDQFFSGLSDELTAGEAWLAICTSHIKGEESSQYLIDRCLMRPRCLIDIVNYCKSFAVNLRHQRIEAEDIEKGLKAYSTDLVFEVGLEDPRHPARG